MSLNGKSILITGGTGSFGRRFVKKVLENYEPRRLIVFSRDELKQFEMQQQLPMDLDGPLRYFLGDVRDRDRLKRAFDSVDIVIHAAALKQVPACEYNPFEAVQTNIQGTRNVIDAAIDCGVEKVLALSTDKAVNPANLYGATKLCAEKLVVQGNSYSHEDATRLSCARYGNVMGSRGSVVPLFLEQRKSGRLTLTDDRMTRFWITLEQGVDFVIKVLDMMRGGEIFVPKIPSVRISDLAKTIGPECEIENIGIRAGEKLHELLISSDEARHAFDLGEEFVIEPAFPEWKQLPWKNASPLPDAFFYRSDVNEQWIEGDQLLDLINGKDGTL